MESGEDNHISRQIKLLNGAEKYPCTNKPFIRFPIKRFFFLHFAPNFVVALLYIGNEGYPNPTVNGFPNPNHHPTFYEENVHNIPGNLDYQ